MADPNKVKVMRQMLPPTCVREVRCIIGMCSYYRRFIPNFSAIAKPLITLTKKFAKIDLSEECQAAFDFLKGILRTVPVLAYSDTSKPYILYTDASDDCIGACLCQEQDSLEKIKSNESNEKPIHYLSNTLTALQTGLQLKKKLLLSFMLYRN